MQIGLIVLNAVFLSNIVTYFGGGIISFQSDKKNLLYFILSTVTTVLGVILGAMLIFVVQNYVLSVVKMEFLKTFVIVLISIIMSLIARAIIKSISRESFYLYEKSYQFASQTVVMVAVMFVLDLSQTFLNSLYIVAGYAAGYLLVQILMFALYDKLDSKNTFKPARNVPVLLYTLCIIGMILSAVGLMFN